MKRVPLAFAQGADLKVALDVEDFLVRKIIGEFCPRFTPGAVPVYVTELDGRTAYLDPGYLRNQGIDFDKKGGMPNVVVHLADRNRLFLIEAASSHGLVSPERLAQLKFVFAGTRAALVFVTAFLTRRAVSRCFGRISWGTSVWAADAPDHMIHLNGGNLAGPY